MRRKGRSAGYLFRRKTGVAAMGESWFVCCWCVRLNREWGRSAGSAARIVALGRFFRLGWVRDIGEDARVPQLASFRLLRFR